MMLVINNNSLINTKKLETRFGIIHVDLNKNIFFPHGIIGLEENKNFIITDIPNQKEADFKILQSLDEIDLSFVIMPYNIETKWIKIEDINKTASILAIDIEDLLIVFIATINNNKDKCSITLNIRAPIFINTKYNMAAQYVFSKSDYSIKYEI